VLTNTLLTQSYFRQLKRKYTINYKSEGSMLALTYYDKLFETKFLRGTLANKIKHWYS